MRIDQTNTTRKERLWAHLQGRLLKVPDFAPDLEQQFQTDYYAQVRPSLRLVSLLLAALVAIQTLVDARTPALPDVTISVPQGLLWLCIFGLTYVPRFGRFWRPVLVLLGWGTAGIVLVRLGYFLAATEAAPQLPDNPVQKFYFVLQMAVLMVTLSTLRLPLRWAAVLQGGVLAIGLFVFGMDLTSAAHAVLDMHFILLPALIVQMAILLAAFAQEQLARRAFWARHLLEEERDGERQEREQTQGQLRVLAQAIGGIVHDLGNPLTIVQLGTELLDSLADSGDTALILETNGAVREGIQMLGALRLSLIEQTRILEGKPILVDLRPEPLCPMVQSGAHFQSPRLRGGREISLDGDDLMVHADRLKLVTVFMNLIGNALKYSDGEVKVVWQTMGETVLVGVLDQGTDGRGITQDQAAQLFTPFGRLEAHASVEGTGLGLISARKIVEAHGGEVFVEGHVDGTSASLPFSTAAGDYPAMLASGFLTGFVIVCPACVSDVPSG